MNAMKLIFYLIFLYIPIHAQWIVEKHPIGMIEPHDNYWVMKSNGPVNRPTFPAYIRFYNMRTVKSEYQIECSTYSKILYHNHAKNEIIFITEDHEWSNGDSYYITLDEGVYHSNTIKNSSITRNPEFWTFSVGRPLHRAFLHLTMIGSSSLTAINDDKQNIKELDEDESRLYIDENVLDSTSHSDQQSSKSTNTGNAFELDLILLASFYRYRTRSCQTILTSDTSLLIKRNRSTICQAEYFSTATNETNTPEEQEERIFVVKRIRT